MEVPECPVCLQAYDEDATIPRVFSCGHSTCEPCIAQLAAATLPSSLPDTIRCPSCTRVVRYNRALGPSALPKNIDLLRFCSSRPSSSASAFPSDLVQPSPSEPLRLLPSSVDLFPIPWTDELFSTWRDWVLPSDAISIETITTVASTEATLAAATATTSSSCSGKCFLRPNQLVSLLPIGASSHLSSPFADSKWFKFSYTARVMEALNRLDKRERDELGLVMAASRQQRGLGRVYGLWMNSAEENSSLCLVSERFRNDLFGVLKEREKGGFKEDAEEKFSWGMVGMELCEALMGLHLQGVVCGNLGPTCFCFDDYGHCLLDLHNVLLVGRSLRQKIVVAGRSYWESNLAKNQTFVSPEVFMLLHEKGVASNCALLEVGYGADVWALACLLVMLLVGDASLNAEICRGDLDNSSCEPCMDQYEARMKKLFLALQTSLLGSPFESLTQMIVSCLNHDPSRRPHASDVWKFIRDLCIKPHFDILASFDLQIAKEKSVCCLVLADLCSLPEEAGYVPLNSDVHILQESVNIQEDCSGVGLVVKSRRDVDDFQQELVDGDLVKGLEVGGLKSVTLQGHRDCITGLAVGGGFLFSSSFDKTVHVWSLKDFSHVQLLSGHEHRVMALLVLEVNQLLCITGDSGGCICAWDISTSIKQEPLKKWYEHNDWRYSGVHSLAFSGSQYLYSGSGDKSIKAWSLQDFSLACVMTGHKSAVSSLLVADGILYSGSWDGTIRLWLLDDHSPLTVFGDDGSGNATSVLSLSAGCHLLVASYENGYLKMWRNDVLVRSMQIQNGAIFALHTNGKWLFAGGWDKVVHIQELSEIECQVDVRPIGCIDCDSVITSLFYWQGKLFVGLSNKEIKVYYYVS